jgi:HNH endonuclease
MRRALFGKLCTGLRRNSSAPNLLKTFSLSVDLSPGSKMAHLSLINRNPEALWETLKEFDDLGSDVFLQKYRFRNPNKNTVEYLGKHYPARAIIGVAYHKITGVPLDPHGFQGGTKAIIKHLLPFGFSLAREEVLQPAGPPLSVITDQSTIASAAETLDRILKSNVTPMDRRVSHAGARNEDRKLPVCWHPDEQFWGSVQSNDWSIEATENSEPDSKYWIPFGVQNPDGHRSLNIKVEVNPVKSGYDPRCSGIFMTDGSGIFLGHSGRLGGLENGAKAAFLEESNAVEMAAPDGTLAPIIVIGELHDPAFLKALGRFVHQVDAFKRTYKFVSVEDQLDKDAEEAESDGDFDFENAVEEREKCLRSITLRRGQPDFRRKLLDAYEERCAISSVDCVTVLEAAHIKRYGGEETNHVQNGLLLRSDLHVLFDAGKIGINPSTLRIIVHAAIRNTEYGRFHDQKLQLPKDPALHPNKEALAAHRKRWGL